MPHDACAVKSNDIMHALHNMHMQASQLSLSTYNMPENIYAAAVHAS